jgi:hypothetical protein
MLTIEATKIKLAEAEFFFHKLAHAEQGNEAAAFGFYLSAFLSAARSVSLVLQAEEKERYDRWFEGWRTSLSVEERSLLTNFNEQRVATVHRKGADVNYEQEAISTADFFLAVSKQGAHIEIWPGVPGTPLPTFYRPVRTFNFDNERQHVVESSREYLAVVSKLVSSFSAHYAHEAAA